MPNVERNGQAEVEVIRHEIGGRHWYEAIRTETRERIKWLTSVTHHTGKLPKGEFFNQWLMENGPEEAERKKNHGAERGNNVHTGIERMIQGEAIELADFTEEEWLHLRAFVNWVEDFEPEFLGTEEIVYDLDQGVAGTADHRYRLSQEVLQTRLKLKKQLGDLLILGDVKTGKNLYEENHLQGNKYAFMHNKLHPEEAVTHYSLLRTNSKHKRKYEYVLEPISPEKLAVFDHLKRVVDHIEPDLEPRFPEPLPETLSLPGRRV